MVTILQGDCLDVLRGLPDESVHCCVTSPPYYGLRDYGVDGQLGLEKTPDEYVAKMVDVFREVRRVLRNDGTCWVNLGDSYAGSGGAHKENHANPGLSNSFKRNGVPHYGDLGQPERYLAPNGLKPKDLIGIPWRVAFALQADGWWLRQDIIWHKPNPMPESVTDRCTKAHEYVFLLAKAQRYYYDAETIKEPAVSEGPRGGNLLNDTQKGPNGGNERWKGERALDWAENGRNKRDVWTVATKPYTGAHFATFPKKLVEPMILAGCPEGGTVLDPFAGSGTTGEVAESLGRNSLLIELNPQYIELIKKRTAQGSLLTKEVA